MPSVQITFGTLDASFARQLAEDLNGRGLDIVLDEGGSRLQNGPSPDSDETRALIVISRSSVQSHWVQSALGSSQKTAWPLPIVIDDVRLSDDIAKFKYADFSANYDLGLQQLLRTIWAASTYLLIELPDRHVAYSTQRVVADQFPPQMGFFAMAADKWSFAAVIESVGDRSLAPQLTRHLVNVLATEFTKLGVPGRDCLEPLLMWLNVFAKAFRIDMKLAVDYPLGAKVAAMAQFEDQVLVGTLGTCGVLAKSMRSKEELVLTTFYSRPTLRVPYIDTAGVSFQAPLGYLDFEGEEKGWADCYEVALNSAGDLVALATFRFPNQEHLAEATRIVTDASSATSSARLLSNTFAPVGRDAVCGVVFKNAAI